MDKGLLKIIIPRKEVLESKAKAKTIEIKKG